MESLNESAIKVVAYRDSKGFAATTWDTLPVKLACIMCEIEELTEALEDYSSNRQSLRSGTREVHFEVADVAMYSLSILRDLFDGQWTMRNVYHGGPRALAVPSELTKALRKETRGAFEQWRRGNFKDVMIHLELLIAALIDLRTRVIGLEGTLASDIDRKIEYAANRPPLHGGKDPRS